MSPVPDAVRTLPARLAASRALRRWGLGLAIFLVVVGVLGFLVAPPLIRSAAERQLSALLDRPVTIARIGLNPYTLAVEVDGLRIAEPEGAATFVTLGHFRVRPSWSSLVRLKPVVSEVLVDTLQVNVIRSDAQRFNFSDLIEKFSKPDPEPKTADSAPLLFAVSNIRIENSGLSFDDRVLKEQHRIEHLNLGLPFIANIPAKVDVAVQPHLDAVIDGSPLVLNAEARPFAASQQSSIALKLDGFDLPALLAYSPVPLPVKLAQAKLSFDLQLRFERRGDKPTVALSGSVDLAPLTLTDTAGEPLLDASRVHLAADVIEPLKPRAEIAELRIEHPVLNLARDAQGRLNLEKLAPPPAPAPASNAASTAAPAPAAPARPEAAASDALPDVVLKKLRIYDGSIRFADGAVKPAASFRVDALSVAVDQLATRAQAPATIAIKATIAPAATLALDAKLVVPARSVDAQLALRGFALPAIQPYLSPFLAANLASGALSIDAKAQVDARGTEPAVRIGATRIDVQNFKLLGAAKRGGSLAFGKLAVAIDAVDLAAQRAEVGSIELAGLNVSAARAVDGSIDLAQFARPAPASAATKPATRPAPSKGGNPESSWHYRVGQIAVSQSALNFVDRTNAEPVSLALAGLSLKAGAISDDPRQPIALDLSATFQRKGRFAAKGTVVRAPLKGRFALKGSELDVASFAPYFNTGINATLASALLKFSGDASFAQKGEAYGGSYVGDLALGNLRLLDRETSEPFAGFGELALSKLRANVDGATPDIDIARVALSDFFAQVLLDSKGRLNIGRLMQNPDAAPAAPEARVAPAAAPATIGTANAVTPAAPAPPPFKLHIGEVALARGNIDYTDNFIQPNFRTKLTAIGGSIGALGTDTTEAAPVDIKASLDDNGPVAINGLLNPLVSPPMLDLAASARDIELTRFAAYSAKYAGYPIVKGKLQVDLHYALKEGQLRANNHIFIDQFTFGDHVDSPTATSLPVRLAISLLKNARGEIDVDVPVSGSLDDPKFSVGGIIWRAFVNLIEKAVTSPFRLLAGALGGGDSGEDLGAIDFAAGSAVLSETQAAKLDKLARAMADRPALRLDLIGHADTALDTPALKLAAVDHQVRLQKLKDVSGKGESIDVESLVVEPAEYEKYLTRAYKAADIKKPRNAVGLAKTLPAEEMKQLLLDNVTVDGADISRLAEARASAVQRGLAGKLEPGRVFAVAPKIDAAASQEGSALRVEFQLRSD